LRKLICERVARIEERLSSNDLLPTGQPEHNLQHHIRVPNKGEQMLSAGPPSSCEPILDRPLASSGPSHDGLHGPVAVPRFFTCRGNDWSDRVRSLMAGTGSINTYAAIIDGEVVVPQENGATARG
jgi:hypothetical protein